MDSFSQKPKPRNSHYPEVIDSNLEANSSFQKPNHQQQSSLYPSLDVDDLSDLVQTLFPRNDTRSSDGSVHSPSAPPAATEEVLIRIPGAILNLVDTHYSVELASGDFSIIRLRQGDSAVAVYACVADKIQWPLAKDETAVKVDDSHYFFSFRPPMGSESNSDSDEEDQRSRGWESCLVSVWCKMVSHQGRIMSSLSAAETSQKSESSKAYGSDQIQVLEGLDPVKKRPGMYIGSIGPRGLHHSFVVYFI
ncbi:hypothetical protein AHAS_Ahas13G0086300 [Arachis hypogaea]|uniref:Senescence domain-containing protein n=1 Tax=Arachis hypogaea TaxID=3818 RepID=A0A445A841_ARAHY|nr:hypothetical protein Ahy_B03g067918 [Arachis hypogaea]